MPMRNGAPFQLPYVVLTSEIMKKLYVICQIGALRLLVLRLGCRLITQSAGTQAPLCMTLLQANAGCSDCRCSSLQDSSRPPSSPIRSSLHRGIRHSLHHHCVVCCRWSPCSFWYLLQIKQVNVYAFPTHLPALSCDADGGRLTRPLLSLH